jgi:hypothetical protein
MEGGQVHLVDVSEIDIGEGRFTVIVCGGRDYWDQDHTWGHLDSLLLYRPDLEAGIVVEGGATGADTLARGWAEARGIEVVTIPAEWRKYGVSAGPIRNRRMLETTNPHLVLALPGGRGTNNMARQADQAGVPTIHILPWEIEEKMGTTCSVEAAVFREVRGEGQR